MDEMNPAFENFLNNMSRLGGSPRETTRRVSPAKFLSGNNLAKQVAINSRKITILKNVIQARRVSTGSMLTSLSGGSVRGVEKEILDIKQTMMSILETLKAQEKFEHEKFQVHPSAMSFERPMKYLKLYLDLCNHHSMYYLKKI